MSYEEKPLSELIGAIEQKDFVPIEEQEINSPPKEKKSNTFMIVVLILLMLIGGMGGYYVYNQSFGEQEQETIIDPEVELEEEEEVIELTEITVPDEGGDVLESAVFELNIPEGWTYTEGKESTVITNGTFAITLVKNPIITGGGWGFMYDGMGDSGEFVNTLSVNSETVQKVTHVFATDIVNDTETENIFGGSVFASSDSSISTPRLELGGQSYLIKYTYEGDGPISVDSQEYVNTIVIMDSIVSSITIK